MKIEKRDWYGEEALFFAAGDYEATMIPRIGANIIKLMHKKANINIVRTPKSAEEFKDKPICFGIPLLLPPGRIKDGTYSVNGRTYELIINDTLRNNHYHGVINKLPFTITKTEIIEYKNAVEIEATFHSNLFNDNMYRYFPHEFVCRIIYRLSNEGLKQRVIFTNQGKLPMPLGVGFHTAFNVPFHSEGNKEDYRLQLSVREKWEVNSRQLPTGERKPLDNQEEKFINEGIIPNEIPLNTTYTGEKMNVDGKSFNGAILIDTKRDIRLCYECGEKYKFWTVWNNNGEGNFICVEPQTCMVDAPNLRLPYEETGLILVNPGDTWSEDSRIFIE